jgi:protein TonB
MFNKLVASQGRRRSGWSPTTVGVSVVLHVLLLAGAVYASVTAPKKAEKEEELVTFVDIPPEAAPEPEQPPPPPPETPPANTPPPPKGFQELIPPIEPPAVIPDVDTSLPAVNPEDFSGIGQAGGSAEGVEGGTPQPLAEADSGFAYESAVLSRQPELRNGSQVQSMMSRLYPRNLQDAGIGGQVTLEFVIEADGTVDRNSVKVIQASHEQFRAVSSQVVERFRFRPGRYQDKDVRVLVRMPIIWQPPR